MKTLALNTLRVAFILMAILDFCRLQAQVTESYFKDVEAKESSTVSCYVKYGNSIIIGGNAFGKTRNMPVVMRIDTLGNTLWNTGTWDTTYASPLQTNTVDKIMLGKDGFVYAYCTDSNTIWKLDPSNGTRLWKKKFPTTNYNFSNVLSDYDATKLLAAGFYTTVAGFHYPRFAIISKATGDTISTHNMGKTPVSAGGGGGLPYFSITSDYQNNIYYSYRDTIVKVAGNNPNISIWKFRHATANAENYTGAHFDSTTASVFFLGYKIPSTYSGKIVKLSASTGSLLSSITATTGDVRFRDMKVQNGYLYATWRHMYVGGGTYLFTATKYDMSAGAAVWSVGYSLTPLGAWDTHGGNGCGAMSIDVDNSGDVYLTGYHTDANYGPSQWGVMKLSGSNGSILWEKTIAEDTLKYNNVSVGMGAVVINNRPYFVGTLETYFVNYSERTKIAMVRMNPATGAILSKSFAGGTNQFPARAVSFTRRGISQTAVLKQEGRYVTVDLYDFNRNLIWSKTLSRHYMLYAGQLAIDPSGTIMVTASSSDLSNAPPFYLPAIDSLHLFMINATGQVFKEYQFVPTSTLSQPISLHSENMSAYMYYTVNNTLRMRKATTSTLSAEVNVGIANVPALFNTNPVIMKPSKLISFGAASGNLAVVSQNKTSLITTVTGTVTAGRILNVNFIRALDTSRILLCGSNNAGKEAVCLFNLTTSDTVWTRVYSNPSVSSAIKCVFNPARNTVYAVSTNSTNVVVRRFNVSNGALVWSYTYAGAALNQDDTPTDVAYDSLRHEILVSGYETAVNSSKALMLKLDTNGVSLDTIVKTGDFPGNCRGYCVSILPDGTQWMGGNLNKNAHGKAGYIFEWTAPLFNTFTSFTYSMNSACSGATVQLTDQSPSAPNTWSWTILPANLASLSSWSVANPIATFTSAGVYTVIGIATGTAGASLPQLQVIQIYPFPTVTISGSSSVCAGSSATLSASGATNYNWTGIGTTQSVVITPVSSTVYSVSGTLGNCTSNVTHTVNVLPLPTLALTNATVCAGTQLTLNATGALSYTFQPIGPVVTPTTTGVYTVTGASAAGCTSTASVSIIALALPTLSIAGSNTTCLGTSVTLTVSGGSNSYSWQPAASGATNNVNPLTTQVYSVTSSGTNGCSGTAFHTLVVNPLCSYVWPGDANSDGIVGATDVLEIGLAFNGTGAARPQSGSNYQAYFANNWIGTVSSGKNKCHADCNGDGVIQLADTLPIWNNFGLQHTFRSVSYSPVSGDLNIEVGPLMPAPGVWYSAEITVASTVSFNSIYGMAFRINFDPNLIDSVRLAFPPSFLSNGSQMVCFRKIFLTSGSVYAATVRTDGQNVSGFGRIAVLEFKPRADITAGSELLLNITDATRVTADGTFNTMTGGSNVLTATDLRSTLQSPPIYCWPNPTDGILHIVCGSPAGGAFSVTDITGRVMMENYVEETSQVDLQLAPGIYFIMLRTAQELYCRRVVVVGK